MSHIPRLYLPGTLADSEVPLESTLEHHLIRVLRLRNGAPLRVFDGEGREFSAHLAQTDGHTSAVIETLIHEERPPALKIHLLVAISRHTRMEWTLEKAVELGVSVIQPLFSERSRVRLDERRAERKLGHWQAIVTAATAQSGRSRMPELRAPQSLSDLWTRPVRATSMILCPEANERLADQPRPGRELALLVGPESGFSAAEVSQAEQCGWMPVRLGPQILRAETAGPAALAAVQSLWGEWRGNVF